jgi:hypothetical protein
MHVRLYICKKRGSSATKLHVDSWAPFAHGSTAVVNPCTGTDRRFTIDIATGQRIGSTIPVGIGPGWAAFTPDGTRFITSNYMAGDSDPIIDVATRKVIATSSVPPRATPTSSTQLRTESRPGWGTSMGRCR